MRLMRFSSYAYLLLVWFAASLISCQTQRQRPESFTAAVTPTPANFFAEKIDTVAQFELLARPASGIIKNGKIVKFLIDNRRPSAAKIFFLNANFLRNNETPDYVRYHFDFAQKLLNIPEDPGSFNRWTYFTKDTETKRYIAGTVQTYTIEGQSEQIYGVSFYPQDTIKEAKTLDAVKIVKAALGFGPKVAFVATGSQQTTKESAVVAGYNAAGISRLSIEEILGKINYIPMHEGEAWGYLRIHPADQSQLTAADIPVFKDLPLDLTVVAGTITSAYQDSNSHINLKSKERNTPNAVLRDAGPTNATLAPFDNKPVHLKISSTGFFIEATSEAMIASKLKERFSKPWIPISWRSSKVLATYDDMCSTRASECLSKSQIYGSKAANLGFLAHKNVLGRAAVPGTFSSGRGYGYDIVPIGFGIPLQFYKDLVDYPANAALKAKLEELITKEKANSLSPAERGDLIKEVQGLFFDAKFPPANLQAIKDMINSTLKVNVGGTTTAVEKIKIRSSANAEDIEGFDGAGLHDSYSAKPSNVDNAAEHCVREEDASEDGGGETKAKMKPKTVACAIKGVYASLWNKRAIEERSFSRIDHATVSMGISVLPAYDFQSPIAANSVVVTRVINTSDVYGFTLSVQKGNNLVTNPDPETYSEMTIAALGDDASEPTSLTVTRFAKPKKDLAQLTTTVLPSTEMLKLIEIGRRVEEAYCLAKPGYYQDDCNVVSLDVEKPKSLDMEFKILENGHFVCKQVREFSGR